MVRYEEQLTILWILSSSQNLIRSRSRVVNGSQMPMSQTKGRTIQKQFAVTFTIKTTAARIRAVLPNRCSFSSIKHHDMGREMDFVFVFLGSYRIASATKAEGVEEDEIDLLEANIP